ncbi:hypothetical protein FGO68_gene14943 [Halteria grandinella]|uniref:NADPH-dependent FMN reductase-like domain-containing protein n=1 Tax=Halteria grandinella TaxID=5974 RepID=A0A8J8SZ23_HALGN|nr:hypothetical protein FGO68_gene14943 [Halteria grandinella]
MSYNILAISGSLRKASTNTGALRAAQALAPNLNITIASIADVPLYNGDIEAQGIPAPVQSLSKQITQADGLILACPEYNYSVSGVLKNTIDWLSRVQPNPLSKKPVAILSSAASIGGGARCQYDLRKILVFQNSLTLTQPEVMIGQNYLKFDKDGNLTDEETKKFLDKQLKAFAEWIAFCKKGAN